MVLALQEVLDQKDDTVFKAASGFGGGVGGMNDICGALLGASMMLSLQFGRGREELKNIEKSASGALPVARLYKWFEKEFGALTCRDLRVKFVGVYYDSKIPWQAELAKEAGLTEKCANLTGKTAARAAEMLWDAMEAENMKAGKK